MIHIKHVHDNKASTNLKKFTDFGYFFFPICIITQIHIIYKINYKRYVHTFNKSLGDHTAPTTHTCSSGQRQTTKQKRKLQDHTIQDGSDPTWRPPLNEHIGGASRRRFSVGFHVRVVSWGCTSPSRYGAMVPQEVRGSPAWSRRSPNMSRSCRRCRGGRGRLASWVGAKGVVVGACCPSRSRASGEMKGLN